MLRADFEKLVEECTQLKLVTGDEIKHDEVVMRGQVTCHVGIAVKEVAKIRKAADGEQVITDIATGVMRAIIRSAANGFRFTPPAKEEDNNGGLALPNKTLLGADGQPADLDSGGGKTE